MSTEDEIFRLANDWLEEDLSNDDLEALRKLVKEDETSRKLFLEIVQVDTAARSLSSAESTESIGNPPQGWTRRSWVGAAAASIAAIAGVALWNNQRNGKGQGSQLAQLDPSWTLRAARGAVYEVISPQHVKLISGEIMLTSSGAAELLIETPLAKAISQAGHFLLGHHEEDHTENETMKMNTMTRLLVLAGSVSLANGQGEAKAEANQALVATKDKSPTQFSVEVNSHFALTCYAQLAEDNAGKNLFFSPYSMSNALLMAAEGARGKTAQEMGDVLGLPKGLRRHGEKGQNLPWEMSVIHTGYARLNKSLNETNSEQEPLHEEERKLSQKLTEIRLQMKSAGGDRRRLEGLALGERSTVFELNTVRRKIDGVTLKVANAVWGQQNKTFEEEWAKTVRKSYGIDAIQEANFREEAESERVRINAWVASQTEGRISELISKGAVKETTRMILVNAIFFKGEWAEPFKKAATTEQEFKLANGETTPVPLMAKWASTEAEYAAFNGDGSLFKTPVQVPKAGPRPATYPGETGFSLVEIPYRGNKTSMVVIAPNDPAGLPALESQLSQANITKWVDALDRRKVHIYLPKFRMESNFDMKKTLSSLGMPTAFEEREADFSGISAKQEGGEDMWMGEVLHQALIEVNEEGTEAAAATTFLLGAEMSSARIGIPFTPEFRADRPFLYLIRDRESGTILFLGRMMNPNQP